MARNEQGRIVMSRQATAIVVISTPDSKRHPRSWDLRIAASGPVMAMMRLARDVCDRNPVEATRYDSDAGVVATVYLTTPEAYEAEMARGSRWVNAPVDPDFAPDGRAYVSVWYAMREHMVAEYEARRIMCPTVGDVGYW